MKKFYLTGLALMLASNLALAALPEHDPAIVCAYEEVEGLMAGEWKVISPTEGVCQSSVKYTEANQPKNTLYYIARGDSLEARILSVVVNVNDPSAPSSAIQLFRQAAQTLSVKLTGKRLPGAISTAIGSQKGDVSGTVGAVNVRVVRQDRADGSGYEMMVHFD